MALTEQMSLYRHLVGARIRSQLQYRTSLAIDTISVFVLTGIDFIVIMALFRNIHALGGWSFREVAFLYGVAGIGFALSDLVIGHIENVGEMIRLGQFDTILLRPAGTLLQVMASDFALRRVGKVLQSLAVVIYAVATLPIDWTALKVVLTLLTVFSGAAIFVAIFIVTSSVQFVIIGANEIANAFTYGGNQFTSYPVSIYRGWLRRLFAYIIPLGFVAYFPLEYVLGRTEDARWVQLIGPIVACGAMGVAIAVWTFAVRKYRSTGS